MDYLLINITALSLPLALTFHPRLKFYRAWKSVFAAIFLTALPFLLWDELFAQWRVWGFTDRYLVGINLFHLPLEEVLFFFCIPYACVFTWHCISLPLSNDQWARIDQWVTPLLIVAFLITAASFFDRAYTVVTFGSLAVILALVKYLGKATWLAKFYFTYMVLLLPFFFVNGALTGSFGYSPPIVWYDEGEIIGIRLSTIPLEDTFYGMLLVLLNVYIYERLKTHWKIITPVDSKRGLEQQAQMR